MAKDEKPLTIHEKWKIDSETGGVGFTKNPDVKPIEIEIKYEDKNKNENE